MDWSKPWAKNHWKALTFAYAKAPCFRRYASLLEPLYQRHDTLLVDFTIETTATLACAVGITQTRFMRSSEISGVTVKKTTRLIQILRYVGASHYISGPSARDYIEADQFVAAGISLEYMEYNYPEYPQLYPPYDPNVLIVDLLFMVGDQALSYITGPEETKQ